MKRSNKTYNRGYVVSETVRYKGKLQLLDRKGVSISDTMVDLIQSSGREVPSYYDLGDIYEVRDCFNDMLYDSHMLLGENVYKIIEKTKENSEHSLTVYEDNGLIHFDTTFYNGGTCLEEMLEDGLEELND